jgi:hypothetical protein
MLKITKNDWQSYEGVRKVGIWNMFSSEARRATGLDKDKYIAIIRHYGSIKRRFEIEKELTPWRLESDEE